MKKEIKRAKEQREKGNRGGRMRKGLGNGMNQDLEAGRWIVSFVGSKILKLIRGVVLCCVVHKKREGVGLVV